MNLFGRFPYQDDYRKGLLLKPSSAHNQSFAAGGVPSLQTASLYPQPADSHLMNRALTAHGAVTGTRQLSFTASHQGQFSSVLQPPTSAHMTPAALGSASQHAPRALPDTALPSNPTAPVRSQQPYMAVGPYAERYMRAYKKSPYHSIIAHPSQDPFQGHPLLLSSAAALPTLSSVTAVPQATSVAAPQGMSATALQASSATALQQSSSSQAGQTQTAGIETETGEQIQGGTRNVTVSHKEQQLAAVVSPTQMLSSAQPAVNAVVTASPSFGQQQPQSYTDRSRNFSGISPSSVHLEQAGGFLQTESMQQSYPAVQNYPAVVLPQNLPYPKLAALDTSVTDRFPVIQHARTDSAVLSQDIGPVPLPSMQFLAAQTLDSTDYSTGLIRAYPGDAADLYSSVSGLPAAGGYVPAPQVQQLPVYTAGVQQSSQQGQSQRGLNHVSQSRSEQFGQYSPKPASSTYQQCGQPICLDAAAQPIADQLQHAPSSHAQDYSDISFAPLSFEASFAAGPAPAQAEQTPDAESGSDDGQYHTEEQPAQDGMAWHGDADADGDAHGSSSTAPGSPKSPINRHEHPLTADGPDQ